MWGFERKMLLKKFMNFTLVFMDLKTIVTNNIFIGEHPSEDQKQASQNDYTGVL